MSRRPRLISVFRPFLAVEPVAERLQPRDRRRRIHGVEQLLGESVELDAGLQLRPGGGLLLDLVERMEDASLNPRLRPRLLPGLPEPGPAVRDDDVRGRDRRHKRRPYPRVLGPGEIPADDVLVGAGDEHMRVPGDAQAVHEDHPVHLACRLRYRPHPPELRVLPPERAGAPPRLSLGPRREQPVQECLEQPCVIVDPVRSGRPAGLAKPSLRPRSSPAVPYHLAPRTRGI